MSRIGKKPITIPENVDLSVEKNLVTVSGPKGKLNLTIAHEVEVKVADGMIKVERKIKSKRGSAMWGTTARLLENMIKGVSEGFNKVLELNGVGFRMSLQGKTLDLALGFSHPVKVEIPEGIEAKVEGNKLTISGIDKQKVGQFAAEVRALKPVEPYKGKGFKYEDEVVRRKEGKKAVASE